jgi:hypothetical protein
VTALAGGIGLGVVAGWLTASVPLPRTPGPAGGLLVALGALVATAGLLGAGDAATGCLAGVVLGFGVRRGLRAAVPRSTEAEPQEAEP